MKTPWYPLQAARTAVGHAFYALSSTLLAVTGFPLGFLLTPLPRAKERVFTGIVRGYSRWLTHTVLPTLGITAMAEVSGREHLPATQAAIYVANHRGYLDTPLLLGVLPRVRVLVKADYRRSLVQRVLARNFDFVSVDARSPESIQRANDQCRALLRRGESLLIYPEGSRARGRRLGEFKHLAFQLAAETGTPLVPVVVHQSPAFMAKEPGSTFPRRRVTCHVRILEPIAPDLRPRELAGEAHRRIARELKALDAGFPP